MRKIKIYHNQVLKNLDHFRSYLHASHHPKSEKGERCYPLLLDCHSGLMQFVRTKEPISFSRTREKRELEIIVRENGAGRSECQIRGDLETDLSPLTQKIAWETFRILNLLIRLAKKGGKGDLVELIALKNLSFIRLPSSKDQIEHFPGWRGACDRLEAEQILHGKPVGTYLLREGDPLLQWLVDQSGFRVEGYLLTIVEEEQKISDYLILRNDRGWAFKKDEPDFDCYHYVPTLSDLLKRLVSTG